MSHLAKMLRRQLAAHVFISGEGEEMFMSQGRLH